MHTILLMHSSAEVIPSTLSSDGKTHFTIKSLQRFSRLSSLKCVCSYSLWNIGKVEKWNHLLKQKWSDISEVLHLPGLQCFSYVLWSTKRINLIGKHSVGKVQCHGLWSCLLLNGPWHLEGWQSQGWRQYTEKSLLLHFSKLRNFAVFYNIKERARGQSLNSRYLFFPQSN